MSLIVVGTMAYDAIETPWGKIDKIVGGSATYVAWAASNYYKNIKQVSIIGGDFEENEIAQLAQRGVVFDGVEIKKDQKSFFWSGKYHIDMNQRDTLATELNVLEQFNPIIPPSYQDCEYLMLGNLSPDVQLSIINQLSHRPKLVVLDTMNFWMDIALDKLKQVLQKIDLLVLNDAEARLLSNEILLPNAAKKIQDMGPRFVIIKKGEHGAMLFYKEQIFITPAVPLTQVFDPTGAGDTFAGGLIGYIAQQKEISINTMKHAMIAGTALASYCVEAFGPEKLKKINQEDIQKRVQLLQNLTQF